MSNAAASCSRCELPGTFCMHFPPHIFPSISFLETKPEGSKFQRLCEGRWSQEEIKPVLKSQPQDGEACVSILQITQRGQYKSQIQLRITLCGATWRGCVPISLLAAFSNCFHRRGIQLSTF
ncbi:hypothetical protein VULLAG_LOCUS15184 [Vulpes lagopus]